MAMSNDSWPMKRNDTARLDPSDALFHIDQVRPDFPPLPVSTGIPESLSETLENWIGSGFTPAKGLAEFVGWDVEEVRYCRRE